MFQSKFPFKDNKVLSSLIILCYCSVQSVDWAKQYKNSKELFQNSVSKNSQDHGNIFIRRQRLGHGGTENMEYGIRKFYSIRP